MALRQLPNFAQTTLNGAINNSQTTLVVTSAALFPTVQSFHILIDSEIILVTGVSGTTFTIDRAEEGSSAASHATLATISAIITKTDLVSLRPVLKFKPADETVTSSTVLQNDNDLILPVLIGEKWIVRYVLIYHAPTAADIKFGFTGSAAPWLAAGNGLVVPATGVSGDITCFTLNGSGTLSYGGAGTGTQANATIDLFWFASASGNITLQWAQDTSNGTGTVLCSGSYLIAHLVG